MAAGQRGVVGKGPEIDFFLASVLDCQENSPSSQSRCLAPVKTPLVIRSARLFLLTAGGGEAIWWTGDPCRSSWFGYTHCFLV